MPLTTFGTRPNAGADFDAVYKQPPLQLGQLFQGSDGHDWRLVQAGAALAKNAAVTIADTTFVATAGAGGWTINAAVANGEFAWARKTAL